MVVPDSPGTEGEGEGAGREGPRPGEGSRPPMVLDRGELDRVIRRAVELQFHAGEEAEGQTLTQDEVLRIGREVGVDEEHLRRALGELRAESLVPLRPEESRFLERRVGPGTVQVSRVVPGEDQEVEAKLAEHFRVGESLTRIRSRQGRSRWEPAEGILVELQRGVHWKGYRYDLARAGAVDLAVVSLEDGYSLVTISADLRKSRSENFFGYTVVAGGAGAAAGAGVGLILAGGWPVAAPGLVVGAVLGSLSGRKAHAREVERLELAMEGILDRLESGEPLARKAPGILGAAGIRPPLPPSRFGS